MHAATRTGGENTSHWHEMLHDYHMMEREISFQQRFFSGGKHCKIFSTHVLGGLLYRTYIRRVCLENPAIVRLSCVCTLLASTSLSLSLSRRRLRAILSRQKNFAKRIYCFIAVLFSKDLRLALWSSVRSTRSAGPKEALPPGRTNLYNNKEHSFFADPSKTAKEGNARKIASCKSSKD